MLPGTEAKIKRSNNWNAKERERERSMYLWLNFKVKMQKAAVHLTGHGV